jgi:hypothetical protein
MAVANTVAYYDTATITTVTSFIVQALDPSLKFNLFGTHNLIFTVVTSQIKLAAPKLIP